MKYVPSFGWTELVLHTRNEEVGTCNPLGRISHLLTTEFVKQIEVMPFAIVLFLGIFVFTAKRDLL